MLSKKVQKDNNSAKMITILRPQHSQNLGQSLLLIAMVICRQQEGIPVIKQPPDFTRKLSVKRIYNYNTSKRRYRETPQNAPLSLTLPKASLLVRICSESKKDLEQPRKSTFNYSLEICRRRLETLVSCRIEKGQLHLEEALVDLSLPSLR
jgi:hypothetical protein